MPTATLWQTVFACELALALMLALAVTAAFRLPTGAALSITVVMFLLIQWSIVAGTMTASRILAGPRRIATRLLPALFASITETVYFTAGIVAMSIEPWLRRSMHHDEQAAAARPLLLVHGFACNGAVWWRLKRRFHLTRRYCVHVVNVEPSWADLDTLAAAVEREVERIRREHRGAPVTLIAHSMGGLVARLAARNLGPGFVRSIVTLGTPHHGAELARVLGLLQLAQMRRGSQWLGALNATPDNRPHVRLTSIYSREDNLVVPLSGDRLATAQLHEMNAIGHFGLITSSRALDVVIDSLAEGE